MKRGSCLTIAVLTACVLWAGQVSAEDGGRFFRRDCARCHGLHARGDGPDAGIFSIRPSDLRKDFLARYSNAELIRRVRRGLPLSLGLDPEVIHLRQAQLVDLDAYLRRLPAIDWDRSKNGQSLYADGCAPCHGVYGRFATDAGTGVAGAPVSRDLADRAFQEGTSDAQLRARLAAGHGTPSRQFTDGEAAALITYVRLLSPGHELYSRFCANCHGDHGRGARFRCDIALDRMPVFDAAYFIMREPGYIRDHAQHIFREGAPRMPHLRHEVSETSAGAVIRFLKALQD